MTYYKGHKSPAQQFRNAETFLSSCFLFAHFALLPLRIQAQTRSQLTASWHGNHLLVFFLPLSLSLTHLLRSPYTSDRNRTFPTEELLLQYRKFQHTIWCSSFDRYTSFESLLLGGCISGVFSLFVLEEFRRLRGRNQSGLFSR